MGYKKLKQKYFMKKVYEHMELDKITELAYKQSNLKKRHLERNKESRGNKR